MCVHIPASAWPFINLWLLVLLCLLNLPSFVQLTFLPFFTSCAGSAAVWDEDDDDGNFGLWDEDLEAVAVSPGTA